jgi:uncharacterized membrane protein YphA (DoxX/SURF4 family)
MINFFSEFLANFFAVLLLFSGVTKMRRFRAFRDQLVRHSLLPSRIAGSPAFVVPPVEVALGLLLLSGCWRFGAMAGAAALMSVFTMFVGYVVATGRSVACFCFGEDEGSISAATLARNLFLLALAGVGTALAGFPLEERMPRILSGIYAVSGVLLFLSAYRVQELGKIIGRLS